MSRTVPSWLADPVALVIGAGESVEAVAHELAAAGATITRGGVAASVEDAATALAKAETAARDPVTLLVHACFTADHAPDDVRAAMGAGLDSPFYYASALARQLIPERRSGVILFLARGSEGAAPEKAACDATISLTKTLAVKWARDGIRVNAIVSHCMAAATQDERASLGGLAAFLASEYAAYITGAVMGIDD